jgi:stage V sporulation protein D (sporulation-specific penicillin-binding protein)
VFGHLNFATAFQHSVNSVFCNVGKKIGAATILEYAKRFGFYKTPPLETPADERAPSGMYTRTHALDSNAAKADPGRLAFGQWTMQVTPLQMAMVASTVSATGAVPSVHRPAIDERRLRRARLGPRTSAGRSSRRRRRS